MANPLFQTTTTYSYSEYKKFSDVVYQKMNLRQPMAQSITSILLLMAGIIQLRSNGLFAAMPYILLSVFIPLIFRFVQGLTVKKLYNSNPSVQDAVLTISFYSDYVEQRSDKLKTMTIAYNSILRVVETKTNFYIMASKNKGIMVVKDNCSPQLIEYLSKLKKAKG